MATGPTDQAATDAIYQMQKTFVHLPASHVDRARRRLAEVERAIEARVREQVARDIHQLKTPAPDGSDHYQAGWDTALEAAADAARNGATK